MNNWSLKHWAIGSLIGIWGLGFGVLPASASEQIKTAITVDYQFDAAGVSHVTHVVTLTNLISQVYATSYTLELRDINPQNLRAWDDSGPLQVSWVQSDSDVTQVTVDFTSPATGKGASHSFNLAYTGPPAVKKGQIWEITLPRLADPEFADRYVVNLLVPTSFGLPAFMSPASPELSATINATPYRKYSYGLDRSAASGVIAVFGNFQIFDFSLTYHLQNSTRSSRLLYVALPPDTPYQRLFYDSLIPSPHNISVDSDGNWLAAYKLPKNSSTTVVAIGQVHILKEPSLPPLPPTDLTPYLLSTSMWPTSDPRIQELAQKLITPRAIYDYVVDTLDYDYSRAASPGPRKGALAALAQPDSAICTEFTDLFITLARAAGIPAREIQGFAYTDNPRLKPLSLADDVLHAWPEYWDPVARTWRSVDPTWGQTTGGVDFFTQTDLSHFAFVIHGTQPDYPAPAGLYKLDSTSKDVEVTVGKYRDPLSATLIANLDQPLQYLPFSPNTSSLLITNPNGFAAYDLPVTIQASPLSLTASLPTRIPVLLPFSTVSIPISWRPQLLPPFIPQYLSVNVSSAAIAPPLAVTYNIPDRLYIIWYVLLTLVITAALYAVALTAHQTWHLYLQRRLR